MALDTSPMRARIQPASVYTSSNIVMAGRTRAMSCMTAPEWPLTAIKTSVTEIAWSDVISSTKRFVMSSLSAA